MAKYVLVAESFTKEADTDIISFKSKPFPNLKERRAFYFYMRSNSPNTPPKIYHISAYNQGQDRLEICLGNSYVVSNAPALDLQGAPFAYIPLKNFGFMEVTNGGFLIQIEK